MVYNMYNVQYVMDCDGCEISDRSFLSAIPGLDR